LWPDKAARHLASEGNTDDVLHSGVAHGKGGVAGFLSEVVPVEALADGFNPEL